ncbi:Uncharacterised protein [Acinetobacter baumannii]|nr:Uncharacterised protein [Acinetobacter baumannii]
MRRQLSGFRRRFHAGLPAAPDRVPAGAGRLLRGPRGRRSEPGGGGGLPQRIRDLAARARSGAGPLPSLHRRFATRLADRSPGACRGGRGRRPPAQPGEHRRPGLAGLAHADTGQSPGVCAQGPGVAGRRWFRRRADQPGGGRQRRRLADRHPCRRRTGAFRVAPAGGKDPYGNRAAVLLQR